MDADGKPTPVTPPAPVVVTPAAVTHMPATDDDYLCMKRAKHRQVLKLTSKICSQFHSQ